ncbi:hypothetical protein TOPH_03401 [Tolypocladium ophioglossoides CBS 100239]|uniref:Uncharacterized protein n=1 Tax=Tolypocladium ophioglossoides (strain CBS 100239) TaxID=1163406 RepID=A0A0L0NDJ8_TOLOC|nr:hypothetical protein TOPH_03401 [Tolypocladium ophioglossoides CBS 100239]
MAGRAPPVIPCNTSGRDAALGGNSLTDVGHRIAPSSSSGWTGAHPLTDRVAFSEEILYYFNSLSSNGNKIPTNIGDTSPKGPYQLVTLYHTPEPAKQLISRVVEDLKDFYQIEYVGNCTSLFYRSLGLSR